MTSTSTISTTMATSPDSFTFTVGKLDAGMAILLGERAHLIEFPSLLLPPGATTGSIVNIAVHRNFAEEKRREAEFWDLQRNIYDTFGADTPKAPDLQLRNVTQTSVTLEWPPLHMATAKLRSLDIYRNQQRLATIPQPVNNTSTKLSGLELDSEYTFQLVLRTTAGTFPSNVIRIRTHTMTDTSGISVCFGTVQDKVLLENAKLALQDMRAKWSDKIQIDTTHFVCTTPAVTPNGAQATGSVVGTGPGVEYQRALQLSIPVVQPTWILACHDQNKMVSIAQYYLGVTPNTPISSAPFTRPQSMSQVPLSRSPSHSSPTTSTNASARVLSRQSMPAPSRNTPVVVVAPSPVQAVSAEDTSTFINQSPGPIASTRIMEEHEPSPDDDSDTEEIQAMQQKRHSRIGRSRNGTMDRDFKFPPPSMSPTSGSASGSLRKDSLPTVNGETNGSVQSSVEANTKPGRVVEEEVSNVEVPPPPPIEKENIHRMDSLEGDEEVGPTEEISLN